MVGAGGRGWRAGAGGRRESAGFRVLSYSFLRLLREGNLNPLSPPSPSYESEAARGCLRRSHSGLPSARSRPSGTGWGGLGRQALEQSWESLRPLPAEFCLRPRLRAAGCGLPRRTPADPAEPERQEPVGAVASGEWGQSAYPPFK